MSQRTHNTPFALRPSDITPPVLRDVSVGPESFLPPVEGRISDPTPRWSGIRFRADRPLLRQVDAIIALDRDPVVRNLLITQCYHELSEALGDVLGAENANWCTFATWASKTAGRFIRKDEIPAELRSLLGAGGRASAPSGGFDLFGFASASPGLLDLPDAILEEVSSMIMQGNLKVFAELGPMFARFLEIYGREPLAGDAELREMLAPLREGPSDENGQSLLRSAVTHWHEALRTDDPDRRAELVLLGNARIGLHEQIRLQPYIAGSIDAPLRVARRIVGAAAEVPVALQSAALERMLRPVVERLASLWRAGATQALMTLAVPNEVLDLGDDVPALSGKPLHPKHLCTIEDRQLYDMLRAYDAHDGTTEGSGANDWADLDQRMSYILELFRSRQCETSLREPPFSKEQAREILAFRKPAAGEL